MNFRTDDNLSILGFGCMRFPKKGNSFDFEEIERELLYAIDNGINYFDMAYTYSGIEDAFGRVMEKCGFRDKVNIATKLPHYMMKDVAEMHKNFDEQLKRLRTDHVDYYLMHMLPDLKTWNALIERGALDWLNRLKADGRIRKLGFSFHGSTPLFIELLNAYDWDFCQVQYNYLDEFSQAGRKGVEAAYEKGIPVIIMEPLRGGRLVNNLPKEATEAFNKSEHSYSPAEWGLRWLWDQPAVSVVLSGMNSMQMLEENIRIASDVKPGDFGPDDFKTIEKAKKAIINKVKVPCTGCGYCMPCPFGVDIPGSFYCLNTSYSDSYIVGIREYLMCTALKNQKSMASLCKECGRCEQHCPQGIPIRSSLKAVKRRFENPIFKIAAFFYSRM
ncbi:MAG: aldo/keto reductase [Lachnospiraceae bacterium]|nr:aldo/keto reductase [Lachnospiraceae bacterium]MBR6486454.1 aldo/keto reductase [Lachnospiraceae bacterium]